MNCLLHICCAPCSVACIGSLREEGISLQGYSPSVVSTSKPLFMAGVPEDIFSNKVSDSFLTHPVRM